MFSYCDCIFIYFHFKSNTTKRSAFLRRENHFRLLSKYYHRLCLWCKSMMRFARTRVLNFRFELNAIRKFAEFHSAPNNDDCDFPIRQTSVTPHRRRWSKKAKAAFSLVLWRIIFIHTCVSNELLFVNQYLISIGYV